MLLDPDAIHHVAARQYAAADALTRCARALAERPVIARRLVACADAAQELAAHATARAESLADLDGLR